MNPRQALAACLLGGPWIAAWVAYGTLRLHQDVPWGLSDRLGLVLILAALYTPLMLLFGLATQLAAGLVTLLTPPRWQGSWTSSGRLAAVLVPLMACLTLPEMSPSGRLLQHQAPFPWTTSASLGLATALAFAMAWLLRRRAGSPSPTAIGHRLHGVLAVGTLLPLALLLLGQPPESPQELLLSPLPEATSAPPPLVLLVIDGADLDDMILPMVEAGELPAFATLMRQGTWGPLGSQRPTLSPVLWTTMATGKRLEQHGIRDFVYFHLPGVRPPIHRFPQASGLNHRLFPLLEKMPLGFERPPYSRLQRRARPLWDIVGERYPVGVYRWLVTWPAAPLDGFVVAGGVYAGPGDWNPKAKAWLQRMRRQPGDLLDDLALHPADAMHGLEPFVVRPPSAAALQAFAPEVPLDRRHKHFRLVARGLADPTAWELPRLIAKYRPQLVAANFYSVDSLQHRFAAARRDGTPWGGAIAEGYRHTDRQLASFLAELPPEHHLVVISDHGYDFALDHHWQAPDGVFFARGPAFAAGRRVEGLGLLDIAPLALTLLDLPLPEDMPGAVSGQFRSALAEDWLAAVEPTGLPRLMTYERPIDSAAEADLPATLSDEMRDELRSLGYVQ